MECSFSGGFIRLRFGVSNVRLFLQSKRRNYLTFTRGTVCSAHVSPFIRLKNQRLLRREILQASTDLDSQRRIRESLASSYGIMLPFSTIS